MTVGWNNVVDLVRALVAGDLGEREQAADSVVDWIGSYTESEATTLAGVLLALVMSGSSGSCREAQLHALVELVGVGKVGREALTHFNWDEIAGVTGSEAEYVEYLKEVTAG